MYPTGFFPRPPAKIAVVQSKFSRQRLGDSWFDSSGQTTKEMNLLRADNTLDGFKIVNPPGCFSLNLLGIRPYRTDTIHQPAKSTRLRRLSCQKGLRQMQSSVYNRL